MEVVLHHDGCHTTAVEGRILRGPWNVCPGARNVLPILVGKTLEAETLWQDPDIHPKQHCTHLLDLAIMAGAQALRGGNRRYEVDMPDRVEDRATLTIRQDGDIVLQWLVQGDDIVAPEPYAGQKARTMLPWAQATLDAGKVEWVRLARRCLLVSTSRAYVGINYDQVPQEAFFLSKGGACFSFQASMMGKLVHNDNFRDFSDDPDALLRGS